MSMILIAALIMAQSPAATQSAQQGQSARPIDVNGKKKPKEKCEYMEVTGSHTRQRVCRNELGQLDLGPNVTDSVAPGVFKAQPVAQPGGFGPTPQ